MVFKSLEDVPEALERRHPGSNWIVWKPSPRGPQWLVRIDVGAAPDGGRPECIGLEVRSFRESADEGWPSFLPLWNDAPAPLQRRTLRDLPLGQILTDLGEEMLASWQWLADALRAPGDDNDERDADRIEGNTRRQRARKSHRSRGIPELAAIAGVYLDAQRRRQSTTKAVATWGQVADSTAAKWIMRVRQETDLLPLPSNRPRTAVRSKRGTKSDG